MNEQIMKAMGFGKAVKDVHEGLCPFCGKRLNLATEFRNEKSVREYGISGLCQSCQDETFGVD
jgi:hypothetical protein